MEYHNTEAIFIDIRIRFSMLCEGGDSPSHAPHALSNAGASKHCPAARRGKVLLAKSWDEGGNEGTNDQGFFFFSE